jgi:hypothetical protein
MSNSNWHKMVARWENRNHALEFMKPRGSGIGNEFWSLEGDPQEDDGITPKLDTAVPQSIEDHYLATKRYEQMSAKAPARDLTIALARRNQSRIKSERARSR